MKVDRDFEVITPSETRDVGFDFSNDVADGETIVSATFTIERKSTDDGATEDASPDSRKSGPPDVEDSEITELTGVVAVQRVTGMVAGNVYRIVCRATTTNGQVLELFGVIPCRVAA